MNTGSVVPTAVHFGIPADDLERAARFYRAVFGWRISRADLRGYRYITTEGGRQPGSLGVILRRHCSEIACNAVDVVSVDECLSRSLRTGGRVAVPKHSLPGIGYLAYCYDTEGNLLGMVEHDPSAI